MVHRRKAHRKDDCMSEIVTSEWDDSKTWSGLAAPLYWLIVERRADGLMWLRTRGEPISVIEDITAKADGRRWLHVSVAKRKNKMPTYNDLQTARKLFVGEHRESYMVFPPTGRYVNIGNTFHLWACMDAEAGVLPHFEGVVRLNGVERLS